MTKDEVIKWLVLYGKDKYVWYHDFAEQGILDEPFSFQKAVRAGYLMEENEPHSKYHVRLTDKALALIKEGG